MRWKQIGWDKIGNWTYGIDAYQIKRKNIILLLFYADILSEDSTSAFDPAHTPFTQIIPFTQIYYFLVCECDNKNLTISVVANKSVLN